jgi:hypothetical protein
MLLATKIPGEKRASCIYEVVLCILLNIFLLFKLSIIAALIPFNKTQPFVLV